MLVFGSIPSRRLGQSLGVNNMSEQKFFLIPVFIARLEERQICG